MTTLQQQMLDFIVEYHAQHGTTPTVRTIGLVFDRYPSTVHYHLHQLEAKGYLRLPYRRRMELVSGRNVP